MAGTSLTRTDGSVPEPTKLEEAVLTLLGEGLRPPDIAKRLARGDRELAKRLRRKIWKMVRQDGVFQRRIAEHAAAEMVIGLQPASRGLAKRAGRRTDAARLLFEATGLHNPKVQHEHGGEIKIKLDMPRPSFGEAIPDVTVVDDDPPADSSSS